MLYDQVRNLSRSAFRRYCGITPETFSLMLGILQEQVEKSARIHKYRGGRKPALSIENKLLLSLSYLREYRTMFHTCQSLGVCETTGWEALRFVENTLIKHKDFTLPGKKSLLETETAPVLAGVDATEIRIERPKKNSRTAIPARKKYIRSNNSY